MYLVQLVQRIDQYHVELFDPAILTRIRVSLAYTTLEKAKEIYDRIPTFNTERQLRVFQSNYGSYIQQPTTVHEQREINLDKLTETANHGHSHT